MTTVRYKVTFTTEIGREPEVHFHGPRAGDEARRAVLSFMERGIKPRVFVQLVAGGGAETEWEEE